MMIEIIDGPKFTKNGRPIYYWMQPRRGDPIPVFRSSPRPRNSRRAGSKLYRPNGEREVMRRKRQIEQGVIKL
jgi:hypothetical protein